jgi:hypothetical protein
MDGIRRVVTGVDANGDAVVVCDEIISPKSVPLMPDSGFTQLWGSDDVVTVPTDGSEPAWTQFFPPTHGFRFLIWSVPPESAPRDGEPADLADAFAELQRTLPGLADFNEPMSGMHTTPTVDFDVVLNGELWLELDNGTEVHLRAGDCVIQNGTRHSWHNRSDQPTTILSAIVGARREAGKD